MTQLIQSLKIMACNRTKVFELQLTVFHCYLLFLGDEAIDSAGISQREVLWDSRRTFEILQPYLVF